MSTPPSVSPDQETNTEVVTYRQAINLAMHDEMAADPTVLLLGEDVAADGGVFKTNSGLVEAFGPDRVRNTPIAENAFVGVALGMSLTGLRPIVEIMFADFLPSAGDAIVNQLPKYRFMSGGQTAVPVTVRSICGAGGRFGTQHSATGESWFIHLPGLRVVTASTPQAAYSCLRAAIRDNNPVLFYEHKALYGTKGSLQRSTVATVGKAETLRAGTDITVAATMLMAVRAQHAADVLGDEGISVEVIDPRWLRPFDVGCIARSVSRTGRLLVVEEQVHAGSWGSALISELVMSGSTWESPPTRISLPDDIPIPYSPPLEDAFLPTPEVIADAIRSAVQS